MEGNVLGDLAPERVRQEARRVGQAARLAVEALALGLVGLERGHVDHGREPVPPRIDPVARADVEEPQAIGPQVSVEHGHQSACGNLSSPAWIARVSRFSGGASGHAHREL